MAIFKGGLIFVGAYIRDFTVFQTINFLLKYFSTILYFYYKLAPDNVLGMQIIGDQINVVGEKRD